MFATTTIDDGYQVHGEYTPTKKKRKIKAKESHDCDLYSRRILAIVQPYKFQHRGDDTKNILLLLSNEESMVQEAAVVEYIKKFLKEASKKIIKNLQVLKLSIYLQRIKDSPSKSAKGKSKIAKNLKSTRQREFLSCRLSLLRKLESVGIKK